MALKWEDKEIRFDLPFSEMRFVPGEKIIDKLEHIEDTKGNSGDRGRLLVTNLRILWHSIVNPRISLSIGQNCITSISTKIVNSKLKGTTQALHLLTLSKNTKFEFIFTNLVPGNDRHFVTISGVHKAYTSSKLYRELKLRGAVVQNKQLKVLPLEQVFATVYGVWNLSSDQGSPGTFIITNIRLIWYADMNEAFNISLPYLQIESMQIRDSKFGQALVIVSTELSGGYVLGFKVDPEEKLNNVVKELSSLSIIYNSNPVYGVEYKWNNPQKEVFSNKSLIEDLEETEEPQGEISNTINSYLMDRNAEDRPPVYCNEIGLAVETIKEGFNMQKLWEVIPS